MVVMSETMDRNVGGMSAAVQNMTNRVHKMSRPIEMFP
jgi:hypothetical protein